MLVATCNRLFQISSETRTIETDDSIGRRYASDTERDRESYTEVCDLPFTSHHSGRSGLPDPDECSPGLGNTGSSHQTSKHKFEDHGDAAIATGVLALLSQFELPEFGT
jgi:hypothetical protein